MGWLYDSPGYEHSLSCTLSVRSSELQTVYIELRLGKAWGGWKILPIGGWLLKILGACFLLPPPYFHILEIHLSLGIEEADPAVLD